jgi:hypothetical protein
MGRNKADFHTSVLLHRGFSDVSSIDELDTSKLGTYWTTDKGIADDFATWGESGKGLTISAEVHPDHVVTEEGQGVAEGEVHVPKGTPVKIISHGNRKGTA